jgi:hypothetical protein
VEMTGFILVLVMMTVAAGRMGVEEEVHVGAS